MINYLLTLALFASATSTQPTILSGFVKPIQNVSEDSITYDELYDEALFNCPYSKAGPKKQKIIETLIEVEKAHNLPESLRGMLLAAACHESGFNPNAKGDRQFSKTKNTPMAIGLFQMWPWWERHYKVDRKSPKQSAEVYLQHVKSKINKVRSQCKHRTETRTWLSAWATAIRSPKEGGRCGERPKFYRVLKRWHKNIKNNREVDSSCDEQDTCGC